MACEFRGGVGLKMFKFKWGAAVGGGLPRYRIGKVLNPPHGARNSAASSQTPDPEKSEWKSGTGG